MVPRLLTNIYQVQYLGPRPVSDSTMVNPDCVQSSCFITSIRAIHAQTCVLFGFAPTIHLVYAFVFRFHSFLTNERPSCCLYTLLSCLHSWPTCRVTPPLWFLYLRAPCTPTSFNLPLPLLHMYSYHFYILRIVCTPMLFYVLLSCPSPDLMSGWSIECFIYFPRLRRALSTTTSPHVTFLLLVAASLTRRNTFLHLLTTVDSVQSLFLHLLAA